MTPALAEPLERDRRTLPHPAFRSRAVFRLLNVPAVGFALAAVTSAVLTQLFRDHRLQMALATAGPTLFLGMIWATLLRWSKTVGKSTFRWGWAASVPLAALNAGLAFAFAGITGVHGLDAWVGSVLMGATFGAIIWFPALVLTMLCFGAPIARAQRLAAKGLAGEERGEWFVGLVCVAMGIAGAALSRVNLGSSFFLDHEGGRWVAELVGLLAVLTGGAATALALTREIRRRRFVRDAEAGRVPGFRVDPTDEGRVLVRVVEQGNYRVADLEEEVFDLDAQGEAKRPRPLTKAHDASAR